MQRYLVNLCVLLNLHVKIFQIFFYVVMFCYNLICCFYVGRVQIACKNWYTDVYAIILVICSSEFAQFLFNHKRRFLSLWHISCWILLLTWSFDFWLIYNQIWFWIGHLRYLIFVQLPIYLILIYLIFFSIKCTQWYLTSFDARWLISRVI